MSPSCSGYKGHCLLPSPASSFHCSPKEFWVHRSPWLKTHCPMEPNGSDPTLASCHLWPPHQPLLITLKSLMCPHLSQPRLHHHLLRKGQKADPQKSPTRAEILSEGGPRCYQVLLRVTQCEEGNMVEEVGIRSVVQECVGNPELYTEF